MGNSSSSAVTTNENNQTIVNRNVMNLVNEQVNSAIAKTTIKNSAECNSLIDQVQVLDLSGCQADGDINIQNVDFKQVAAVDFKCIQVAKVQNEVAQEIMTEIMGQIKSGMDNKSINKMAAVAKGQADSGFMGFGQSDSSSATHNKYNLDVTNDNTTNIQNIVKTAINVDFTVEDVQKCVNEIRQRQELNAADCKAGGDVNISDIEFNQGATALTDCLQQKGISQKITTAASNGLGVIVEADTKTDTQVEQEGKAESEASTGGLGDLPGDVIGGIGSGVGGLLGGLGGGLGGLFDGLFKGLGGSCNPCAESSGFDSQLLGIICCVICLLCLSLLAAGSFYAYQQQQGARPPPQYY